MYKRSETDTTEQSEYFMLLVIVTILCLPLEDWRLLGNEGSYKVRLSNAIAANTAVFLRLVLMWRPQTWLVLENPKGTWLWKQTLFESLIRDYGLFLVLTYFGLWGMDLLKGTHLQTNCKCLCHPLSCSVFFFYVFSVFCAICFLIFSGGFLAFLNTYVVVDV